MNEEQIEETKNEWTRDELFLFHVSNEAELFKISGVISRVPDVREVSKLNEAFQIRSQIRKKFMEYGFPKIDFDMREKNDGRIFTG